MVVAVGLVVFRIIAEHNVAAADNVRRAPLQSATNRRDDHEVSSGPTFWAPAKVIPSESPVERLVAIAVRAHRPATGLRRRSPKHHAIA
jgi:hypothetical protein